MDDALLKYRAFVRVVERGSFTKAAEEPYRTQSSVSKMIADLENDWGMTLLERGKSGVRLTGAGEQLLPYVRRILRGGEELIAQIGRMKGLEVGTVRIGTFASAAIDWLPNIFTRMQADLPGIDYEMLLGDHDEVERWIDEGRVDCGFLRLPTQRSFDTLLLTQDEYVVVLPVGHPLTKNESIAVRQLEGEPFFAAGARRADGGDGSAGAARRVAGHPLHHVGRSRDHGDGGARPRHRDPAAADPAPHPLSDRNPPAGRTVLPADRTGDEGTHPLLPRRQTLPRRSALPAGRRVNVSHTVRYPAAKTE